MKSFYRPSRKMANRKGEMRIAAWFRQREKSSNSPFQKLRNSKSALRDSS